MVGGKDLWPLELPFGAHVHKITNGRVFYTALYVTGNDFDAGKSNTWAIVRALNIKTFLGPEIASSRQASAVNALMTLLI